MEREARKNSGIGWLVAAVVLLAGYALAQTDFAQDTWRGWQYTEPAEISEVREEMELTDRAERIFLATAPALETAEDFNAHCQNQREDVSLLGCYVDGKMYIYDVQSTELADVKKVTAAHELLHAAWARMNWWERDDLTQKLQKYEQEHQDWVESELEYYNDEEKMEELYTRVATKVRELPEDLEEHYRKYFTNRLKIVEFYESYQAPFEDLRAKCADLREKTDKLNMEIIAEREKYEADYGNLKEKVDSFNNCAATAGCFTSETEFLQKRKLLEDEGMNLQKARESLNQKIDEYNNMVMEYESYRAELGGLSDSMNSKINKVKEGEL